MKTLGSAAALVLIGLTLLAGNAGAQTETNLHWFSGGDGGSPTYGPVQGSDGNFYGTTVGGATQVVCSGHCGTVFKISPSGSLTNLYWFSGSDGTYPNRLDKGSDGNFYGTTYSGGTNNEGTIFRISPSGTLTTLYTFGDSPNDGTAPYAGLIQGNDGNFYGTTQHGGANINNCGGGCGTVFRMSPSGTETTLYSFAGYGRADGQYPTAALVQGSDGNFYGTTQLGGKYNPGTVFRISPSGSYTNLHSFDDTDGEEPSFALVQGSDGNFYGTTPHGGTGACGMGCGTVFRISPTGSFTNLHSFSGTDGYNPNAPLVLGSDGNFYGTTAGGTTSNTANGTVFRISPSGSLTSLYSFSGSNGIQPNGLVQGSDGNYYGTTFDGGVGPCNSGCGSVFKLNVLLNPPANQISAAQITGNDVAISIPSVEKETYQLQFTTDLTSGNWSNLAGASVTNSIGALMTLTNFGGALLPQGFYRFDITP